ncbi:MAG: hypothetical protein EOP53_16945 [Sphingobacteriales bacterium]|nr:MAG: hypothetical protein EOP53_16945 [Sphingobacteriales bacterium]
MNRKALYVRVFFMKSLQELATFVSQQRLDVISTFPVYSKKEKNSKFKRFVEGIISGEFNTDEEAAENLYKTGTDAVKYRVLKTRLRERLHNNILFFYSGKRSGATTAINTSLYRQLVIAKLMLSAGIRNAGYELIEKTLVKAMKYQTYDIVEQCALHFRRYSMMQGDAKEFEKYNTLFQQAHNTLWNEAKAEELYSRVMIHFNESFAQSKELVEQVKQSAEELLKLRALQPTFLINYYTNSIQSTYYYLIRNYEKAIVSCDEYEAYLKENPTFYTAQRHAVILSEKAGYYLHIHDFEKGISCAQQAIGLYKEGSINWFLLLELYFLLLLNKNDITKATELYINVISHDRFQYIRPQQQELWKIFGGYLWFTATCQKNDECINKLTSRRQLFRFSKLLNEIPHFAKDKKGMNVAVLILQILLLLQKKEYVAIISRTEALKSYIYRNLDKDAHRSHVFIKLLLTMEKAQFDYEKTRQKTKNLLEKLSQVDLNYAATQARMEIIPYEQLWQTALGLIK